MMERRYPIEELFVTAWLDEAGGKTRKLATASRSAIVMIGQDELEHIFVLETWAKHAGTTEIEERVFDTNRRWRPRSFGIDATGTQGLFADTLVRVARDRHEVLPLRPRPMQGDKLWRIENELEPVARAGRLFRLPEAQCAEFEGEWKAFPNGYLDILDALACAITLLPRRARLEDRESRINSLRTYLRSTGAKTAFIDKRIREVYGQS